MNGRFQMQGGKNWIFPKEMNASRFFWDSHWLEIWSNHFYPSMGPNEGSVAMVWTRIAFMIGSSCCYNYLHVVQLILNLWPQDANIGIFLYTRLPFTCITLPHFTSLSGINSSVVFLIFFLLMSAIQSIDITSCISSANPILLFSHIPRTYA
jgi:hypothetical protein